MKTAIVGCGHIATIHIPYILKTKDVRLVALCDQNELRACELATQHKVRHYTDFARMLVETNPNVVHILTPPQSHATLAIQALEAGCHVLVEKPLCLTRQEAEAIYAAAQSSGRLVGVDHNHLWSPLVRRAIQAVASGQLGRVLRVHYVMGDDYLEIAKSGQARWALEMRGGALCDLIPHPLYLIRAFLPDIWVLSAWARGTSQRDLHELSVEFAAAGGGASLWMSLNQRPLEHSFRVYCSKGTIHVDLRNFCMAVTPEQGLPGPAARIVNTVSESQQRGLGSLGNALRLLGSRFDPRAGTEGAIRAFYRAIREGGPSPVSQEEAIAVVDLSTAIWDQLEKTPGAIHSALDERGQPIEVKRASDFPAASASSPPLVLVTGGTGFIGRHLVRRLISDRQRVRVLCRDESRLDGLPTKGVEIAIGDVGNLAAVCWAMERITTVYHLAATMSGDWAAHYQGTVVGSQNVLQAAYEAGVSKMVYLSSLSVLHASRFRNNGAIDESFPLEPRPEARGSYSRAKLEAERIATRFAEEGKLPLCIIRPGLVYGPGNAEFLTDAGFRLGNDLVLVVGLGGRRLGLTYVENLVDALCLAAQSQDSCGKIYYIVDPDQPTVRQYIKAYSKATGHHLTAIYIPTVFWAMGLGLLNWAFRLLHGSSPNLSYRLRSIANSARFDTTAAREGLGWQARVPFEQAMMSSISRN